MAATQTRKPIANGNIGVRVSFTTGAVRSAILATAGLLVKTLAMFFLAGLGRFLG